jgi:hypothetical protein
VTLTLPILDRRCGVHRKSKPLIENCKYIDWQRAIVNIGVGSGVSRLLRMILWFEAYEHANNRLRKQEHNKQNDR